MIQTTLLTVPLKDAGDEAPSSLGAKALHLARLMRAGLPVPPGFCVTARAYRDHLAAERRHAGRLPGEEHQRRESLRDWIRRKLAELESDPEPAPNLPAVLAEIRGSIAAAPLEGSLRLEIERRWVELGARSVAVRSSATAEDLPEQSFAGQHDTYLGVTDLETCLERVKGCWASLWSERAFEYRRRNGVAHLSVDMAVIVEALVPAETAGVLFTADPVTGRRDRVVIEASYGLGEAVVAGKVAPDRIVVSKRVFRVERRTTAHKAVEVVPRDSGGTREKAVDAARSSKPCLDDVTASRLALLGAEVESMLGGPQDVEWALAEGKAHLLQARPITALPPEPALTAEERQIWTNANLCEAAPDVLTPMTWSGIQSLAVPLVRPVFGRLGIDVDPFDIGGLVAGRIYFNVNMLVAIGTALGGASRLNANALFGDACRGASAPGELRIPEEDLPRPRVRRHRLLLSLPGLLWALTRDLKRRAGQVLTRFQARVDALAREPWRELNDEDLAQRILSAELIAREELLAKGRVPLLVVAGMVHFVLSTLLCRRWLGDPGGEIAHRLLAGLGGMEDAEAGIALWKLAATAGRSARVDAAIREEEQFAGVVRRLTGPEGAPIEEAGPFLREWSEFVEAHGHHGRGEFELGSPRWAEEPDHILGLVRSNLAGLGRVDPVAQAERLARERRELERDCLSRLRNPIRRWIFRAVLSRAQEGLRFRETIKSRVIRFMALTRQMLLELGGRLERRGILGRRDDVFFLEKPELVPVAAGRLDPRGTVGERRAEYERNVALHPPAIVIGRFDPDEMGPEVPDERARELRGLGVSAGVATGKARTMLHPGDGHVLPGEVLVAPFTDPSWAPHFVNAAAIVMDQGGLLSHGSIVAREYGIPCVVGVGPATSILRTGRTVRVDGHRGVVTVLGEGSEP